MQQRSVKSLAMNWKLQQITPFGTHTTPWDSILAHFSTNTTRTRLRVLVPQIWSKRLNQYQLDPFKRFNGKKYSAKDYFRKLWALPSSPMLAGNIFEALVAHQMVYHMQCESCKCRGHLFWNGGFGMSGSWADVVCRKCMASYEIKSRPTIDKIERDFQFNSFRGNSFRMFCGNPARYQARYLVVVCRGETYLPKLQSFAHRVSVARIAKLEPRLCGESFLNTNNKNMRMISAISIDMGTLKKDWCFVKPYKDDDHEEMAREVFDKVYGDGAWSNALVDESHNADKVIVTNSGLRRKIDVVEQSRKALEKLKVSHDDDDNDGDWKANIVALNNERNNGSL
mmetsp:Transcript_13648/g.27525  ORF Transcript_13648/g.27525 Transcript_13648/m.27525 type:complete len:340 (-) Transcript_13648:34-1053(-)